MPIDKMSEPLRVEAEQVVQVGVGIGAGLDQLQLDAGRVAMGAKPPLRIVDIGDAARHPGREVAPDLAQDRDDAAGHIFAGVVARAFDYRHRARISDRETLRSEEHTSELQSLMRISYAVFCLKKKTKHQRKKNHAQQQL